jgi:hypothetical protein
VCTSHVHAARHLQQTVQIFTRMGYLVYQVCGPPKLSSGGCLNYGKEPTTAPHGRARQVDLVLAPATCLTSAITWCSPM